MAESGADHRSRLATSAKAWACRFKARSTGRGVVSEAVTRYFKSPPSESPADQGKGQGEEAGGVGLCLGTGLRFNQNKLYLSPFQPIFGKFTNAVPLMAPPSVGSARGPSPASANPRADERPPTK